jgi:tRNA(His) guanylyltransferase
VHSGKTEQEAQRILKDTNSAIKNEMLFTDFSINYNNESELFRKGTILYREEQDVACTSSTGEPMTRRRKVVVQHHTDMIGDEFWNNRPWLLSEHAL